MPPPALRLKAATSRSVRCQVSASHERLRTARDDVKISLFFSPHSPPCTGFDRTGCDNRRTESSEERFQKHHLLEHRSVFRYERRVQSVRHGNIQLVGTATQLPHREAESRV